MSIKDLIKNSPFFPVAKRMYAPIYDFKWRERRLKTNGKLNPDKTFYVCRRVSRYTGLLSDFLYFLGHVRYARSKGYIPVIDLMTYPNVQLYPSEVGKVNGWEYYFKQPCDENGKRYSLNEVYKSKNVILSNGIEPPSRPKDTIDFLTDLEELEFWHDIYISDFEFSDELKCYLEESLAEVPKSLIGVHARGTGYRLFTMLGNGDGNNIQPEINNIILEIEEKLKEDTYEGVFLATEDAEYYDFFRKHFGSKLFTVHTEYFRKEDVDLKNNTDTDYTTNRANDKKLRGFEYITAMVAFSRCKYRISGINSGTIFADIIEPNVDNSKWLVQGRAH